MGWDILGTSHGTVYSWEISMGCPIGTLYLEAVFLAAAAEAHLGATLLAAAAMQ